MGPGLSSPEGRPRDWRSVTLVIRRLSGYFYVCINVCNQHTDRGLNIELCCLYTRGTERDRRHQTGDGSRAAGAEPEASLICCISLQSCKF